MFFHIFKNRIKIIFRNKSMMFWTLIFPLALATFFNLAFSNLNESTSFNNIDIAVVENENYKNESDLNKIISTLSTGKDKIFNTKYVGKKKANSLLDDSKIIGYVEVEDKTNIVVKSDGIEQTILKYVVDNYYQINSTITTIVKDGKIKPEVLNQVYKENNYFKDTTNGKLDFTVVYFYTLIGMVCLYAAFFGMMSVNDLEANLSKKGARSSISPANKFAVLLGSLAAGLLIQYIFVLILLVYLVFILHIDFGNQIIPILILTFFGTLAGITLGMLVGVTNKRSEYTKEGIIVTATLVLSFLAGMMILDMKYLIQEHVPILAKVNPVNMITDALYSLYYFDTLDRYIINVVSLVMFSVVMTLISFVFIRRKKYDSI